MEFDISCLSTTTFWPNINLLTGVKYVPLLVFIERFPEIIYQMFMIVK